MRKQCKRKPRHHSSLKMSACPWRITMVFQPIEKILHRMETDCTVDTAQGRPIFREDGKGGWYDMVEALRGVIEFHRIAEDRHGIPAEIDGMIRFANKLNLGAPIFEEDIAETRQNIESCKRQALKLKLDEATDIVKTIQIKFELSKIKPAPTAISERSKQAVGKQYGAGTHKEAA